MYKNILIISSDITGHGHKSITESLLEQFRNHPGIKVKVIEGFALNGVLGIRVGKMYGPITRASKETWKLIWDITEKKPSLMIEFGEATIHDRFVKILNEVKPDVILTIHPNYNASITNILEKINSTIPVFAVVADPVSISALWCNPKATYTLCPTEEARESCLKNNVPEERIRVFGFPVRQRFYRHLQTGDGIHYTDRAMENYVPEYPLQFLIMSGGEGSGNMSRYARILLKNFDCRVKLLCGRNKLLKKRLEHTLLEKYADRVEVLGFTENVQDLMLASDVILARASPNTMTEAIMCNIPLVITGALPGQEEGNPGYAEKHGLGVICTEPSSLKTVIAGLLANNFEKLMQIKKAQARYRNPNSARDIVEFILRH